MRYMQRYVQGPVVAPDLQFLQHENALGHVDPVPQIQD